MFKFIASSRNGARTKDLLKVANATVRSILSYGSEIYSAASVTNRKKLEPINNAVLRIATGLPKNTPIEVLLAETQSSNIANSQDLQCCLYSLRLFGKRESSATATAFWHPHPIYCKRSDKKKRTLAQKVINLLDILCLHKSDICQWTPPTPSWESEKFSIITNKFIFQTKSLDSNCIKSAFLEFCNNNCKGKILIATDGSKTTDQTSIGICIPSEKIELNFQSSTYNCIFTTEALAIITAVDLFVNKKEEYVIFTDSLSVLHSLLNCNRKSPATILKLQDSLIKASHKTRSIELMWIPGHQGIDINESADRIAKQKSDPTRMISTVEINCLIKHFKKQFRKTVSENWKNSQRYNNFKHINVEKPWDSNKISSRKTEVMIHRLRARKLILNDFLYKIRQADSPNCDSCNVPETTEHFFLHCSRFKAGREKLFGCSGIPLDGSLDFCEIVGLLCSSFLGELDEFLSHCGRF